MHIILFSLLAALVFCHPYALADEEYDPKNNDVSSEVNAFDLTGKTKPKAEAAVAEVKEEEEPEVKPTPVTDPLHQPTSKGSAKVASNTSNPTSPPHLGGTKIAGHSVSIGSDGVRSNEGRAAMPDVKASHASLTKNTTGSSQGSMRTCRVPHGFGVQYRENGSFGPCRVTQCEIGYVQTEFSCTSSKASCQVADGQGAQHQNNGAYGACTAQSCDSGYVPNREGECMAKEQSCSTSNGTGVQYFTGVGYSVCGAKSCDSGFTLFQDKCFASSVKCDVENGAGLQYFKDGNYGKCTAVGCNKYYSLIQGVCFADTRKCDIKNGSGVQYFDGKGGFGECIAVECNKTFAIHKNACWPDFSGKWKGFYSYKTDSIDSWWTSDATTYDTGTQVLFTMENTQNAGEISGTIVDFMEPWTLQEKHETLRPAHFKGTITQDGEFEFTKIYHDPSWPFDNPVKYSGKLSGGTSSGAKWLIQVNDNKFTGAATFAGCKDFLIPNGRKALCE